MTEPQPTDPPAGTTPAVPSYEMLPTALDSLSEGFVLFDAEGRLVLCNRRYREAYPQIADMLVPGAPFREILRQAAIRGGHVRAELDMEAWIDERMSRHEKNAGPVDLWLSDGRYYRLSEHAVPGGGIVKLLTEITALHESETRYRDLVEQSPFGIAIAQDSVLCYANPKALEIMGADRADEVLGRAFQDYVLPGGDPLLYDLLSGRADDRPDGAVAAVDLQPLRGRQRHVEIGVSHTRFEGRDALRIAMNDVTARQDAERALQHAQKMDAIGQLAGGVAHEFNNLLTAMGGFAQMGLRAPGDQDRLRYCLQEIVSASERAAAMTRQLLDFARRETDHQSEYVDIARLLAELDAFLRPVLGEAVATRIETPEEAMPVMVDRGALLQAIVNLAINGRDAMPGGGTLRIGARILPPGDPLRLRHPDLERDSYAAISVTDEGVGIDHTIADRIFEPFYTTKAQGQGTGLGLPMVYATAVRAGGSVDMESAPGEGATFTLLLPITAIPEPEAPAADVPDEGGSLSGTVLLVEDDPAVLRFVRMALQDMGLTVISAGDVATATAAFARSGDTVDMLLCDIVLPDGGGDVLARRLARQRPDLPIVLMTGYSPVAARPDVQELAPGRVLAKPVDRAALSAVVRDVFEG